MRKDNFREKTTDNVDFNIGVNQGDYDTSFKRQIYVFDLIRQQAKNIYLNMKENKLL